MLVPLRVPDPPEGAGSLGAHAGGCRFPSGVPVPPGSAVRAGAGGPSGRAGAELPPRHRPSLPTRDEVIGEAAEIEARRRRQRRCSPGRGSPGGARRAMTERCSLWSALSAAACCFYRGSFMQVQVSGGGGRTRGRPGCPALGAQTPRVPPLRAPARVGKAARMRGKHRGHGPAAGGSQLQYRSAGERVRGGGLPGEPRCSPHGAGRAGCGQRARLRPARSERVRDEPSSGSWGRAQPLPQPEPPVPPRPAL